MKQNIYFVLNKNKWFQKYKILAYFKNQTTNINNRYINNNNNNNNNKHRVDHFKILAT